MLVDVGRSHAVDSKTLKHGSRRSWARFVLLSQAVGLEDRRVLPQHGVYGRAIFTRLDVGFYVNRGVHYSLVSVGISS